MTQKWQYVNEDRVGVEYTIITMAKREKLVLVDGKSVFHRGYHAMPGLTNSQGVPTSGIYGFANMALRILSDLKPDYVIVGWDKAKTSLTTRVALYPEYKAQRIKQPDDFYEQIPYVRQLVEALGWPLIELDNYEADDIIGVLAKQAKDMDVIIVTGDLDALQLVDERIKVYAQHRGISDVKIYDIEAVKERYGLTPKQLLDFKALKGDASDNIPGVKGIGEKTAGELIAKYDNLEEVYAHLEEIKPAVRAKLESDKDMAFLSRKLVDLMMDAPVKLDLESAKAHAVNRQQLHELFRNLEFKSLLNKIPGDKASSAEQGPLGLFDGPVVPKERTHLKHVTYTCIQTASQLDKMIAQLSSQKVFAFDVETDSVDVISANLVGLSASFREGEAFYVPLGHRPKEGAGQDQLELDRVVRALKPVLENPDIQKVGHNIKFDYEVMRKYGITLSPIAFDTMVAAFLLNPLARSQSLSDLSYRELGIEMIPIEELIGRGKEQSSFDRVSIEDAARYAAEDADISWRLYQLLAPQLDKEGLSKLAADIEWPLIPVLAEMELEGVALDSEFLRQLSKQMGKQIMDLEEKICDLAGTRFNISSPSQLATVLFDNLGLSKVGIKKGKTGFSTAASELDKLRGTHPVVDLIGEYRELVKLKSTYVDALPEMVSRVDGRIHTSFNQTIAQTGRLSSNNPNLQNIPIRTEVGRQIRQAFVAGEGKILVSADYSQFELRIAAALSHDQAMIKAFEAGVDVHAQTAAELYGVGLEEVSKEQRYNAKTINFGVLYGMSAHGLSVATGMSREEAAGFIKRYYEVRPALAEYIEKIKAETRKLEYAATLFGRRRPLPEINSNNHMIAAAAERMAVNVPIQGTQADIMKIAMIALAPLLDEATKMLVQIHDQLILETDMSQGEQVMKLMKQTLENVYDLGVPVVVETSMGGHWGEL